MAGWYHSGMRPYGMKSIAALVLLGGMVAAASPVGDEAARRVSTLFGEAETSVSTQLAAGGAIANDVSGSAMADHAPAPTCTLIAQPDRVAYGGSTIAQWATTGADRVVVSGIGDVERNGTRVLNGLTLSRMLTIRAEGRGGAIECIAAIEVLDPRVIPTCLISAYPSVISAGGEVAISWGSEGASSVHLSDRGVVASRGGFTVIPSRSTEFTLTVFGPLGQNRTCTARVTVR